MQWRKSDQVTGQSVGGGERGVLADPSLRARYLS